MRTSERDASAQCNRTIDTTPRYNQRAIPWCDHAFLNAHCYPTPQDAILPRSFHYGIRTIEQSGMRRKESAPWSMIERAGWNLHDASRTSRCGTIQSQEAISQCDSTMLSAQCNPNPHDAMGSHNEIRTTRSYTGFRPIRSFEARCDSVPFGNSHDAIPRGNPHAAIRQCSTTNPTMRSAQSAPMLRWNPHDAIPRCSTMESIQHAITRTYSGIPHDKIPQSPWCNPHNTRKAGQYWSKEHLRLKHTKAATFKAEIEDKAV